MKKLVVLFTLVLGAFTFFSCEDSDDKAEEPHLIVKFQFDPNQVRLNNLGQPATIPSGHAAQSPDFRKISAHYFELAPTAYTQLTESNAVNKPNGMVPLRIKGTVIVKEEVSPLVKKKTFPNS